MNSIDIRRPHALTLRQSKNLVDTLAQDLADRYGAGYRWEEDTLRFSRFGLRGAVHLLPGEIHFRAELGFLFLPLRDGLVSQIQTFLMANESVKDPKKVLASARQAASVRPRDRPEPKPARKPRVNSPRPKASIPDSAVDVGPSSVPALPVQASDAAQVARRKSPPSDPQGS